MNNAILACSDLSKVYQDGVNEIKVLNHVNLQIKQGERVAILGPSGSGKSTLLHLLGTLEKPSAGDVFIDGENIARLSERRRSRLRNRCLGFVYQFHHLLAEFNAWENVAMPLLIRGVSAREAQQKAQAMLAQVGLEKRLTHKIGQLSGGERQRTAIARALVLQPRCVLADEPTGNLDQHTAEAVQQTILELNKELQVSLLIVTHDTKLASRMDRVLNLVDGELTEK